MKSLGTRVLTVIMIIGIIFGYDRILEAREKDEEIARLTAELASADVSEEESGETETSGSGYADGVYEGEADGFGGVISVQVEIEEGMITSVEIISAEDEDTAYLEMAEGIIPSILEAQSAEVDAISGATFSSEGIRDAVSAALQEASE